MNEEIESLFSLWKCMRWIHLNVDNAFLIKYSIFLNMHTHTHMRHLFNLQYHFFFVNAYEKMSAIVFFLLHYLPFYNPSLSLILLSYTYSLCNWCSAIILIIVRHIFCVFTCVCVCVASVVHQLIAHQNENISAIKCVLSPPTLENLVLYHLMKQNEREKNPNDKKSFNKYNVY